MLAIKTILHPTDFSFYSEPAFQLACALARDYGARLVVMHVKPMEVVYGDSYVLPPDPEPIRRELQAGLDSLKPADPSIPVERVLTEGEPVSEIVRVARERSCDLIVMGTHGRTGLGRFILGSVAEGVVRKAPCPVLTMKTPVTEGAAPKPRAAAPAQS